MNIAMLFGIFFVLVMLSVPIGVSLGLATSATIILTSNITPTLVAQKAFTGLDTFTLLAIPFFMLAGNLMAYGGIARRIVNLADAAVGKFTGGLGMATVIGCMFFAAISGSGPATVVAMGSIMIPEMVKRGYKGIAREAGGESFLSVFWDSLPAIMAPVIILGGIYTGAFSPTESAVVGSVYALLVGKFVYHELDWKTIIDAYKSTADTNGMTGLALGFSMAFASYLTMEQIPTKIANFLLSAISADWLLILMMLIVLLIFGLFVDNISSCLILTPVFLPVATRLGMTDVHFGIMMTVALAIGFVTPPYGVNLFVASSVSKMQP